MPTTSSSGDHSRANSEKPSAVPIGATVVLVAAVAAAWIASGSTGLLAHPLRHALTWAALAVAIVAGWPRRDEPLAGWLALAVAVVLGLIMTAVPQPAVNVLAVTLVTAALARTQAGLPGRVILIASLATAVLAVFRLACSSIPTVWLAADAAGWTLGRLAGKISGEPLWLGASFGGVDFLVLMAALFAGWLISTAPPRLPRAIYAAAAILLGHLIYLTVLAFSGEMVAALPDVVVPPASDNSLLGVWAWGNAARTLLPWNLPVLAGLIHVTIAAAMFRWAAWLPVAEPDAKRDMKHGQKKGLTLPADALLNFGPAVLAVAVALLIGLGLNRSDLRGKTVVAAQQGFVNWDRPKHDMQSPGMYGMLEWFVKSLGGEFVKSADLSPEDLRKADVLLLLHPNQDWSKEQEALDRIWEFVRRGGSLLLVADPEIREGDAKSTFNDVLEPTGMWVRRDTAISETGNWEDSCEALAHPATIGVEDGRNRFGLAMGSSIRTRWPARPLLVGRWAWSNPGSGAARTGTAAYDPGEKLGDLVLAAEQRIGRGTVVVLGDTSSLHNDVIAGSYPFLGRLLGYLARRSGSPQAWWRQLLGLLAVVAWVGLLARKATPMRTGATAVVLAGSLVGCVMISQWVGRVLPGSSTDGPELACIDASHLEAYSSDTWSNFGIGGFSRTLMRNGYLPLLLPKLTPERLEHAELLISIGPARRFSTAEREAVRKFVESGGTFICMAGAEHVAPSREMIEQLGLSVPPSPVPPTDQTDEPEPLGAVRTLYLNTKQLKAAMQSYASWEVKCSEPDGWKMAQWSHGTRDRPFVISRPVGRGTVVVIGDTYMAVNQNLESAAGVMPENVVFWRWLLTHVTAQDDWTPPADQGPEKAPPGESGPSPESKPPAELPPESKPPAGLPFESPPEEPPGRDPAGPPGGSIPAGPNGDQRLPGELPDELPPEDPMAVAGYGVHLYPPPQGPAADREVTP